MTTVPMKYGNIESTKILFEPSKRVFIKKSFIYNTIKHIFNNT